MVTNIYTGTYKSDSNVLNNTNRHPASEMLEMAYTITLSQ